MLPLQKIAILELIIRQYLKDKIFKIIGEEADKIELETYVVGGFVRDMFLGRPCKDIDVVTVGDGIELANRVASRLGDNVNVNFFGNFGTANIKTGEFELEFVGARKESYRYDSRKPEVQTGTLDDDLSRRDFTINALAICLNNHNFGKLVDKFGGMRDLEKQTLKTPLNPDITFSDDPLRMMRAIRFATQLNFNIHPDSYDAIKRNAERIKIVSKERIADELNKIVLASKPSIGFKLLETTGLLTLIFPEMQRLKGVEFINGKGHKDNFYHTLQVLDNLCKTTDNLWLRWSAIMHDIAKPPTKRFDKKAGWTFHGHEDLGAKITPEIFRNLGLPQNEKMRYVQKLVKLHLRPIALVKEEITDSAIRRLLYEAGDDIDDLMLLCEADITSKNDAKVKKYLQNFKVVRQKLKDIEEKDHLRNFQPPVNGKMIMDTFGIGPTKQIGDLKTLIKNAILDGQVKNEFEDAYNFMLSQAKQLGLEVRKNLLEKKSQN